MTENKGYTHPEALIDAEWVQAHLTDPTVRLIEVDVDTTAYEQGHIPGAVGFNWQRELQDQMMRAPVSKEQLEALLGRAGVELTRKNGVSKVGDSFMCNGIACSKAIGLTYCHVEWVNACEILPKTRLAL
jgi:hypothetical protein